MNITNVMKLNDYCLLHRSELESPSRGTLADLAAKAAGALEIKVPVSAMRDMMNQIGISTKRMSKRDAEKLALIAENERLEAEVKSMRLLIAKLYASKLLPEEIRDFIFASLPEEMRAAVLTR